jgi:hypothetical protein
MEAQMRTGITQIVTGPGGNSNSGNYCKQVRDVIQLSTTRNLAGVVWFDLGIVDVHERAHVTQLEGYWNTEWATLETALEAMTAPNTVCTATAASTQLQPNVRARILQSYNNLVNTVNGAIAVNETGAVAAEAGTRTALVTAICTYARSQSWPACGACPP